MLAERRRGVLGKPGRSDGPIPARGIYLAVVHSWFVLIPNESGAAHTLGEPLRQDHVEISR